jgi:hypothetical protein
MSMGRSSAVQDDLMATWAEMPRSPGHAFYDRLRDLLGEAGFDAFVEPCGTMSEIAAEIERRSGNRLAEKWPRCSGSPLLHGNQGSWRGDGKIREHLIGAS